MRDEEYFVIKDRAAIDFLKFPNVNAVGLGGRERAGRPTGEIVIKVFVTQKKAPEEVPPEELIPTVFEGVPTDVVVMGPIEPLNAPPGAVNPTMLLPDQTSARPLKGGTQISVEEDSPSGTMGCVVVDRTNPTAVYGLTAHHTVADEKGKLSLSRRIEQPNLGSGFIAANSIGIVAAGANDSTRDAGLFRLAPQIEWRAEIEGIGAISGTHNVTLAECASGSYAVRKRGAWTRLTGGVVEAIGSVCGDNPSRKKNAMIIRPNPDPAHAGATTYFGYPGDSGSVVVNDANEVVALLYGGSHTHPPDTPTEHEGKGFATPIDIVLARFNDVEKLDLQVVTAASAPAPVQTVPHPSGVGRMTVNDIREKADDGYYRPVTGGSRIVAEPMSGHYINARTLGCLVEVTGEANAAYVLSSYRSISPEDASPATTDTDVGQPDNDSSFSGCCRNTIGQFAKGGADNTRDAAIVKLEDGIKWLAEILEVGFVKGIHTVTATECASGTYQVRKRGAQSRLTGGVVTVIGGVHGTLPAEVNANAMLIQPNPNPSTAGDPIHFSHFGDEGAVIVNENDEVVGLLYDSIEVPPGSNVFHGVATPIQAVLDRFDALDGVTVTVATAAKVDDTRTVVLSAAQAEDAMALPLTPAPRGSEAAAFPRLDPFPARLFAQLQEDLSGPGAERLAAALWGKHRGEIRRLIDQNRRVATAWHRSGGSALLQALFRTLQTPSATVPTAINGLPVSTCIDRLHAVFKKYGSKPLRADLDLLRPVLLEIGGLTISEIIRAFESHIAGMNSERSVDLR